MRIYKRVVRRERFELVRCSYEWQLCVRGNFFSESFSKTDFRVDACTNSCTTLCERPEVLEAFLYALNAEVHLSHIARELLTERQRCRILRVRTTDFNDVFERLSFVVQRVAHVLQRRQKTVVNFFRRRDVHRCRERVVGGL